MDPEPPQNKNEIIEAPSEVRRHLIKKYGLFFSVAITLIVLSLLAYQGYKTFLQKKEPLNFRLQPQSTPYTPDRSTSKLLLSAKNPDDPIAKIGEETIYMKDFNYENSKYPAAPGTDANNLVLQRLIEDSIILQAAQKEKLITLNQTTFNSLNKDYTKRSQLLEKTKKDLQTQVNSLSGVVVAIWFLNDYVGPLGYEKAKQIAFDKITKLNQDVKSKKITIFQAAKAIQDDSSLAELDKVYKTNALYSFKISPGEQATWSKEMNDKLWTLNIGEVSDVYAQPSVDKATGKTVDSLYSFGQILDKKTTGKEISFTEWLEKNKENYEIIYY